MLRTICSLFLIKLKSFHSHKNSHNTILFSLLHHCCFGDLSSLFPFTPLSLGALIFFLFFLISLWLGALSFYVFFLVHHCRLELWIFLLHTSPNKPTHKHSHTHWKLQGIWEQCKAQIGDEANFHTLLFSFWHPSYLITIFISYYSKTDLVHPLITIGGTLW